MGNSSTQSRQNTSPSSKSIQGSTPDMTNKIAIHLNNKGVISVQDIDDKYNCKNISTIFPDVKPIHCVSYVKNTMVSSQINIPKQSHPFVIITGTTPDHKT